MSSTPDVQPLPYNRRRYLFIFLVSIFVLSLPAFMFYAIGYRFDFSGELRNIIGTGGMYVTADTSDVDIYLNGELVNDVRIFRSASYIQNLNEQRHTVTVQKNGQYTWTKELPVFPHIVTEVQAFNMPLVPQVRVISEFLTSTNQPVVMVKATSTVILPFASTTNTLFKATSSATSTYRLNPEFDYVTALFASTSATSSSLINRVIDGVGGAFQFSGDVATSTLEVATTSIRWRDVMLYRKGDEVFARWEGSKGNIPYYYCIDHETASTTKYFYGDHVYQSIKPILASSSLNSNIISRNDRTLICRDEIRIDRKWQQVKAFDFFPGSLDLVLMLLEDGLHVVEVDDRSWQNTQRLYPGRDLLMVLDGGQIYLKDGPLYLEVFTELEQ